MTACTSSLGRPRPGPRRRPQMAPPGPAAASDRPESERTARPAPSVRLAPSPWPGPRSALAGRTGARGARLCPTRRECRSPRRTCRRCARRSRLRGTILRCGTNNILRSTLYVLATREGRVRGPGRLPQLPEQLWQRRQQRELLRQREEVAAPGDGGHPGRGPQVVEPLVHRRRPLRGAEEPELGLTSFPAGIPVNVLGVGHQLPRPLPRGRRPGRPAAGPPPPARWPLSAQVYGLRDMCPRAIAIGSLVSGPCLKPGNSLARGKPPPPTSSPSAGAGGR